MDQSGPEAVIWDLEEKVRMSYDILKPQQSSTSYVAESTVLIILSLFRLDRIYITHLHDQVSVRMGWTLQANEIAKEYDTKTPKTDELWCKHKHCFREPWKIDGQVHLVVFLACFSRSALFFLFCTLVFILGSSCSGLSHNWSRYARTLTCDNQRLGLLQI